MTTLTASRPIMSAVPSVRPFHVDEIRHDFPILSRMVHGKPLVYLDNAATTQKPRNVIESVSHFYRENNANIHRGVHALSEHATALYEDAREKVRHFLNANSTKEIVFVRGATEGINLVAATFGHFVRPGDEILISAMEHHSNIVPWQLLCERTGAHLRVIPINDHGELDMDVFPTLLTEKTRLLSLVHVSNSLGTINPAKAIIELAHHHGIPVLLDGAQTVLHFPVDVAELDCDFYVFSGHKLFGPTGIGVLYGKESWLEKLPPYQGGGDMIRYVSFEKTTYNDLPFKFEAGTPNIAGAIGLGAAIDYLNTLDWGAAIAHENALLAYGTEQLSAFKEVRLIGTAAKKAGILSFVVDDIHPHDIGTILDREGIAIRAGHHCTQPLMDRFGVPATARASFAFYNTMEEVNHLIYGIKRVLDIFS